MSRRSDPYWRDEAANDLLVRQLPSLDLKKPLLVVGDAHPDLFPALAAQGRPWEIWNRRCRGMEAGTVWPPSGPFGSVLVRLPRSKDELAMSIHASASVLSDGGSLLVYGANDEGIRSAGEALSPLVSEVTTVATGGRCRILMGARVPRGRTTGVDDGLDAWKTVGPLGPPPLPSRWVSYPGVFAHGRLDEGTRLFLSCLPSFPEGARVLDYGCGSGAVGWAVAEATPGVRLLLLDTDALALEAARENVPGAEVLLREGLPVAGAPGLDCIVSNPPFHRGKAEDPGMLVSLIDDAPAVLHNRGSLVFVAQRRMALEPHLTRRFRRVEVLGEDPTFRVWRGERPIRR